MDLTRKTILVVGTYDTKDDELSYLAGVIRAQGGAVRTMDVSALGNPKAPTDISRHQVAEAAGCSMEQAIAAEDENFAMQVPDASANPYTAVADVLQAARLGLAHGCALPEPEAGDCFDRIDAGHGVAASLGEAVADLVANKALCDAVGAELCEHHIFMKRAEVEKTKGIEGAALRDY